MPLPQPPVSNKVIPNWKGQYQIEQKSSGIYPTDLKACVFHCGSLGQLSANQ